MKDLLSFLVVIVGSAIVSGANDANSVESLLKFEDRCTTIIVGAKAGTEGPMTTHTSDCSNCDFRINKVPAKDWPEGSMRPLYLYKGAYPQVVTSYRGLTWHPDNLEGTEEQLKAWGKESEITGHIPQVPHTFALYEAGYGIQNEKQVAIGESTCASKLWAAPVNAGGFARIEVREMSQIALERASTAREAIQIMGDLAVDLGFYAADWSGGDASLGEGGEALTVVDKTEAWVFHVTADDTGKSAIWVAQRVEDDHTAAVANQFIIRKIDPKSPNFMYSNNVWDVAQRKGWWKPEDGLLDWLQTFAPKRAHSPYATRRVWRVFNVVAPSVVLPANTDPFANDYPFSVKVDKPISYLDLIKLNSDHYEGTPFDLTKGVAAGPYGDPNRFDMAPVDNMTFTEVLSGSFERPISMFRTSYSIVAQARTNKPDILSLLWYGQYTPSASTYTPMYVASELVPLPYMRGSLFKYDSNIAFWNFCSVGNYAARFYKYAMQEVNKLREVLVNDNAELITSTDNEVLKLLDTAGNPESGVTKTAVDAVASALLTKVTIQQANKIVSSWRDLLPILFTKYHDGYISDTSGNEVVMKKLFYPKSWLDAVGYFLNKPNSGPDVILFDSNTLNSRNIFLSVIVLISLTVMLTIGMMKFVSKRMSEDKMGNANVSYQANLEMTYQQVDQAYSTQAMDIMDNKKKSKKTSKYGEVYKYTAIQDCEQA